MQSKGSVYEGKTLDDAVKKGLEALGLSRAEVMITVMEEGSGGFLGLGARPYRVRVMPRPGGAAREPVGSGPRGSGRGAAGPDRGDRGGRRRGGDRSDRGDRGGRGGDRMQATERGGQGREPRRGGRDERGGRPVGGERGRERGGRRDEPMEARGGRREDAGEARAPRRDDATEARAPRRDEAMEARGPGRSGNEPPRMENGAGREERGGRRRGRRGGRGRGGARREERGGFDAAPETGDAPRGPAIEPRSDAESFVAPMGEPMEPMGDPIHEEHGGRPEREPRVERGGREERHAAAATAEITSEELVELGRRVTEDLLKAMGFEGRIEARAEGTSVEVTAEVADDEELLTGRKGETRQALQHLLNRMVNRGEGSRYHLQLEINDFWRRREVELQEVARALADEASSSGAERLTEYLNAQERRIVHVTLRDDARVKTYAIGDGLIKKVAIAPADAAEMAEEARPEA